MRNKSLGERFGTRLYPGTLRGLRSFQLSHAYGTLWAHVYSYNWHNGLNKASCSFSYSSVRQMTDRLKCSGPPDLRCTCGFYAYFDRVTVPEGVTDFLERGGTSCSCCLGDCDCIAHYRADHDHNHIFSVTAQRGIIEAEGRIIVGELGFRAERATIKALEIGNLLNKEDVLKRVKDIYPSVQFFDTFDEMKEAYPVMTLEEADKVR